VKAREGKDPLAERRSEREAESVNKILDRYLRDYVKVHCRTNTAAEYEWLAEKAIKPRLGTLMVKAVIKADVERFHRSLAKTPRQANHAVAVLMGAFRFAGGEDGANPCRGL
jgi:hypothetical protein